LKLASEQKKERVKNAKQTVPPNSLQGADEKEERQNQN